MSEVELITAIKRREYEYTSMQILYDLAKTVKETKTKFAAFRARYKKIDEIRNRFLECNDDVNRLQLKLKPSFVIDHKVLLSFDELYYCVIEFADSLDASAGSDCRPELGQGHVRSQVRLPKLELPKFDGNLEKWQTFKDSYTALVHNNSSLSDTEKFHYLLSCLSGYALTLAKGVPVTSANYSVVFATLLDRYDNKRILATAYLDKIIKINPIQKPSLSNLSELSNTLYECVSALRGLCIDDLCEFILFYIASRPLDTETRKRFELQNTEEIPKFNNFITYLQNYIKVLEVSQPVNIPSSNSTSKQNRPNTNKDYLSRQPKSSLISSNNNNKVSQFVCVCCNENHSIYRCSKLHSMNMTQRQQLVKDLKLCQNCLRPGHTVTDCKSESTCFICNAKHNTLLHEEHKSLLSHTSELDSSQHPDMNTTLTSATQSNISNQPISTKILGTAVVRLKRSDGSWQYVRTIIDSGSMDSFITSSCARQLGLHIKKCKLNVSGIGQNYVCSIKGHTFGSIIPRLSDTPQFDIQLVVLPKITSLIPSVSLPTIVKDKFTHLDLADQDFDKSGPIDLLLGVDCFDQIYTGSRFSPGPGFPCALSSVFGWVISGQFLQNVVAKTPATPVTLLVASSSALDEIVQRFWESEEPPKCKISGPEDEKCEQKYKEGTHRTSDGRYVVPIMLKDDAPALGKSYKQAFNRFLNWKKRLASQNRSILTY